MHEEVDKIGHLSPLHTYNYLFSPTGHLGYLQNSDKKQQ